MKKMLVDKKVLEQIAKNSRIELSEPEKSRILPQLQEVTNAFSALDKLDTKNVPPSFQPINVENIFREDKAEKSLSMEEALSLTKNKKEPFFKGPRVI